jgi:superfamily II DNA or RNA helicase
MKFEIGSLVKARQREWVVLPESKENLLLVRPMGGTDAEITGIYLPLEKVEPAQFQLPDPSQHGDYRSCRLLRDAMRLGFRSSTGPFRSFARLGVEPRPYQLVPLLMALKINPVRLLIADDVGVGKTIEAGLIVRELLDRGMAQRLAVICPPHLVDQWQEELEEKFNIDAQPITAGSATRLERHCGMGQTLFDIYPYVVVSLDFIKSDKRRDDFKRSCPELVIIDEAHTCAFGAVGRGRQQRHQLVKGLAENPARHMIFLTATPHSGNENAFRSLISFLHRDFENLPDDLTEKEHEKELRRLAKFLVQRRRRDIVSYMDTDTHFPKKEPLEETYTLSPEYKALFNRVLEYARERVEDKSGGRHGERVRWWSALALLRALASSPAAAAATLRTRAAPADTLSVDEADDIGQRTVLDLIQDEAGDSSDVTPGSHTEEEAGSPLRRRLLKMARDADALKGEKDSKLQKGIEIVKNLLKDGFRPVIFCRFIHTADYLAEELKKKLGPQVTVSAVTGSIPSQERQIRVEQLAQSKKAVLVATDCLSEGINLQEFFDAVFHYDLSWNPTRHEQREGRVDRFGQDSSTIRAVTYYGLDNQIDGIVLDVLIRKHNTIQESLKISVPVPTDTNQVIEAIFEGLLLREHSGSADRYLPGFEEFFKPQKDQLHKEWEEFSQKEDRSRRLFTHSSIKVDEVARELAAVRNAVGSGADVESFFKTAMAVHHVPMDNSNGGYLKLSIGDAPESIKEAVGGPEEKSIKVRFQMPAGDDVLYLHRTHQMVEGMARYVMDSALDPLTQSPAKRCGVIRTGAVERRTTLLLIRFRFHISNTEEPDAAPLLAEECRLLAFEGAPHSAKWLDEDAAERVLEAEPKQNTGMEEARYFLSKVIDDFNVLVPHLEETAHQRADALMQDHMRVSAASGTKQRTVKVEPLLPADVPGIYIYLPAGN